jgi:CheY-like chemotaxis protein
MELSGYSFNGAGCRGSRIERRAEYQTMQLSGAKQAIYELIKRYRGLPVHQRGPVEAELAEIMLYLIRSANRVGADLVGAATRQISRESRHRLRSVDEFQPSVPANAPESHQPARILIVEDERIVAADLQEVLNGFGYDAYAIASSGAEALAIAREKPPDIVLMDIRIDGELDGIEAAMLLRQEFDTAVIFLSAYADDATVERAKLSDPAAYLIKPVSARALKTTIELTSYQQHQAL